MPTVHPPIVRAGARIAVTCPASPPEPGRIARGIDRLRDLGFEVVAGASCSRAGGLWAGADAERAEELAGFLRDPEIPVVLAGRGGVGCMRLLPLLPPAGEPLPPTWIVGRSDLTALHLAFWKERGWVGLSGPMAAGDLGREEGADPAPVAAMLRLLGDPDPVGRATDVPLAPWRDGEAAGPLLPVNLSLLASMVGTPFLPRLDGAILVVEEIGEPPHRIDRMLTQIELSGAVDRIAGLVYGQFTRCDGGDDRSGAGRLQAVLRDHAERIGAPTLAGFPYGHESSFIPLPFGTRAAIRRDPPGLELIEGAARRPEEES